MVEPGSQRPFRVVLADSSTLTSLAELPVHTLAELGFVPADPDGIALAAAVAGAFSTLVQHARTLKDAALLGDPAAVDELASWPQ